MAEIKNEELYKKVKEVLREQPSTESIVSLEDVEEIYRGTSNYSPLQKMDEGSHVSDKFGRRITWALGLFAYGAGMLWLSASL